MMNEQEILIKIKADSDKATKKINELSKQVTKLSKSSHKSAKDINKLSRSFNGVKNSLVGMGTTFLSFEGAKSLLEDFRDLDQKLIEVSKTTGLTGKNLEDLDNSLIKMSQQMKGISITELEDIAATAGQLGISGKKNILSFSKAISMIAVATDLTANEAAHDFAVLRNILKEPIANVEKLGSVMNRLTNTSEANAKQIVEYTKRIGAQGKIFGLTSADIMALSATLVGVGATAEAGGSAMSRVMAMMVKDVKGFANASNMSFNEFSTLVRTKPVEALQVFFNAMGKLDKFQQEAMFKKLHINSVEMKKVIQLMGTATKKLAFNINNANQEYKNGNSLVSEYKTQSTSLTSAFKDLNNEFVIMKKRLGKDLSADIKRVTNDIVKFMQSISAQDIKDFAGGLKSIYEAMKDIVDVLKFLNDIAVPDWLAGKKNAGALDTAALGYKKLAEDIKIASDNTTDIGQRFHRAGNMMKTFFSTLLHFKITNPFASTSNGLKNVKKDSIDANKEIKKVGNSLKKINGTTATVKLKTKKNSLERDVKKDVKNVERIKPKIKAEIKTNVNETKTKISSLNHVKTSSKHSIKDNASVVARDINSLNGRNTTSTHTIRVVKQYVNATGGIIDDAPVKLATGGLSKYRRKRGKIEGHDLTGSDDVFAKLTRGEYVHNVRAVDYYGQSFMEALNRRLIPKRVLGLASGGSTSGGASNGSFAKGFGNGKIVNLNLKIKDRTFPLKSDEDIASSLAEFLERSEF